MVNWHEAVEFCRRLSARPEEEGRVYRLPTEAEWEYACRGGAPEYQVFHHGDSLSSAQANFDGNLPYGRARTGPYAESTCKVGLYPANAFGLYDLHGNVWEWCADWYDGYYYGRSPREDPPGPARGAFRVVRGGSWFYYGQYCRSAYRVRDKPSHRDDDLGFRVAVGPSSR
jgi:formylglycine-generating enzyme required for sulfatase activity